MIYTCEEFYAREDVIGGSHYSLERSMPDKIAMAAYVASRSDGKSGVDLTALLSILEQANDHSCLSVYVNVYGRPVSYVVWGYCDSNLAGKDLAIWFGSANETRNICLLDFAITEGSIDETIARWIDIDADLLTVRRIDRIKRERTYAIPRLRKFPWRVSSIDNRFSSPKDHAMAEHEDFSRKLIDLYRNGCLALKTVYKCAQPRLEVGQALPLAVQLIEIDQCIPVYEDEICIAVLIIALSDRERWGGPMSKLFERTFREFVDGHDVIIVGIFGSDIGKERALEEVFSRTSNMGENIIYLAHEVLQNLPTHHRRPSRQIYKTNDGPGGWAAVKTAK